MKLLLFKFVSKTKVYTICISWPFFRTEKPNSCPKKSAAFELVITKNLLDNKRIPGRELLNFKVEKVSSKNLLRSNFAPSNFLILIKWLTVNDAGWSKNIHAFKKFYKGWRCEIKFYITKCKLQINQARSLSNVHWVQTQRRPIFNRKFSFQVSRSSILRLGITSLTISLTQCEHCQNLYLSEQLSHQNFWIKNGKTHLVMAKLPQQYFCSSEMNSISLYLPQQVLRVSLKFIIPFLTIST